MMQTSFRFRTVLGSLMLLGSSVACGPSLEPDRIMTPDERIEQEEREAYEAELKAKKNPAPTVNLTEEDETKNFDLKQAKLELRRATLSAVTCPDVRVDKKNPKGEVDLNIVFLSNGHVKEVTMGAPFAGSGLEECITQAYQGVVVPPFKEAEYPLAWRLDLTGKKRDLMKEEKEEVLLPGQKEEPKEEPKDTAKGKKKAAKKK
jgi:hypothetical protein